MLWKSKNVIRLKFETGLQLWETWMVMMLINRTWENIRENIKVLATESLGSRLQ
jgi:hypothetical protein